MNPSNIRGATRALGAPDSWDPGKDGECHILYVREHAGVGKPLMQSAWYPDEEELRRLNSGEPVILTVWGRSHPPVALNVVEGEKGETN